MENVKQTIASEDSKSKSPSSLNWLQPFLGLLPLAIVLLVVVIWLLVVVAAICKGEVATGLIDWTVYFLLLMAGIQRLLEFYNQEFKKTSFRKFKDRLIRMEEIRPGDHISVSGNIPLVGQLYKHHGIVVEFGEVIDFAPGHQHPVRKSLVEFVGSRTKIYRRDYESNEIPVEITVAIANILCNGKIWTRYNLFSNNCEHFVSVLKTATQYSGQIYSIFKKLRPLKKLCLRLSDKSWGKNLTAMPIPQTLWN
jgi:hypothetical protein